METSGWSRWMRAMPSGAAISAIRRTERRPGPLDGLDRRRRRVAGREHRVEQDHVALGDVVRQLHVVLDRLERLLVAVEPDEADAGTRDQREDAVEHPHAGTEDRADGDLLPARSAGPSSSRAASRSPPLSSARSFVASYVSSSVSSLTSCRNICVVVVTSRSSPSLCWTSGWSTSVTDRRRVIRTVSLSDVRGSRGSPRVERPPLAQRGAARRERGDVGVVRQRADDDPRRPRGSRPSSKPRIVAAGVPRRTPEATVGGRSSNGTVFRFAVSSHLVQPLLGVLARPFGAAEIELEEMRVGASGEHVEPALDELVRERVRVRAHLRLVLAERLRAPRSGSRSPSRRWRARAGRPAAPGRSPGRSPRHAPRGRG